MVHTNDNEASTTVDIKSTDPVRNPAASTTNEDITRAEGEGMFPTPAARAASELVTVRPRRTGKRR